MGTDEPPTFAYDKCRSMQPPFSSSIDMTPFSDMSRLVISPLTTWNRQSRIIITHPLERATRFGKYICHVGEVLDHSFSGVVSNCGHVKCTPQFLTAVESKLCKWKMASEFLQGANGDLHLVTFVVFNFPVRFFERCFNCRVVFGHEARNKKPSSWWKKLRMKVMTTCVVLAICYLLCLTLRALEFRYRMWETAMTIWFI